MIVYNDIIGKLKDAGYNTNRIRQEQLLSESVLQALRSGRSITMAQLDKICGLLQCQPGDILGYDQEDNSNDNI